MFEAIKRRWALLRGRSLPKETPSAAKSTDARSQAPSQDSDEPEASGTFEALALNLGIDFGTSFTKVCFRDAGREESAVIQFPSSDEPGLIPSLVGIGEEGDLSISFNSGKRPAGVVVADYLKMRLAGETPTYLSKRISGIELSSPEAIRALSSWFIAKVIERSKEQILRAEVDRVRRRTIQWSANVGVPVEYCDSPLIKVFEEVLRVAWRWNQGGAIPRTVGEALAEYPAASAAGGVDVHAVPEIAAAVHSFVNSRNAAPGIYVYFDIGGGTVDGVSFKFFNDHGERTLNFYSGRVAPLGVAVTAAKAEPKRPRGTEAELYSGRVSPALAEKLKATRLELQQLVAAVVLRGRKKDPSAWEGPSFQGLDYVRRAYGNNYKTEPYHLLVFVGGGGAKSDWYREAIVATHSDFKHGSLGLPPYRLVETPAPSDLDLGDLPSAKFKRFAIAYGLSLPEGEGAEVRLPSQFDDMPSEARKQSPSNVVDYADSKEAYE